MKTTTLAQQAKLPFRVSVFREKKTNCHVTRVRVGKKVEVAARDGWLYFWTAGEEIRIGPITPEQAEKLSEDLGYEAVA
jgi:hypothetical protein